MVKKIKILFLCIGNTARSQIAEGLFNQMASEYFECYSAGSEPSQKINPVAEKVLDEVGVKISGNRPKSWNEFLDVEVDFVVSLCEEDIDKCPANMKNAVKASWSLPDPATFDGSTEEIEQEFRNSVTSIRSRLKSFLELYDTSSWRDKQISSKRKALEDIHEEKLELELEFSKIYRETVNLVKPRPQGLICIHSSELRLTVKNALSKRDKGDIIGSISMVISLVITLLSASFKNFYFSPHEWVLIFKIALAISVAWFVFSIYSKFYKFNSSKIEEDIMNRAEHHEKTYNE